MDAETIKELKALCPSGRVWNLAGASFQTRRQAIMETLTGARLPKAKCGVNALEAAFRAFAARHGWVPGVGCEAAVQDSLEAWMQTL